MIDLYLFNTVINLIWYIFTIIFLLYRFTSFFNYIYNFIRFCSRLFGGINYIYTQIKIYINKKRGYVEINNDIQSHQTQNNMSFTTETQRPTTIRENIIQYWNYGYNMLFGKSNNNNNRTNNMIPLVETTMSNFPITNHNSFEIDKKLFGGSKINRSTIQNNLLEQQKLNEKQFFENTLNDLSKESKFFMRTTETNNSEKKFFEDKLNELCSESLLIDNKQDNKLHYNSIYDHTLFHTVDLSNAESLIRNPLLNSNGDTQNKTNSYDLNHTELDIQKLTSKQSLDSDSSESIYENSF
jgi:hypothetical protein